MLYLSQPVGVGFSYETTETDEDGRYSLVDPDKANTTEAAAIGAWHILQAFLDLSPQLDPDIQNFTFNLWTESYGGHYGPAFYNYFYKQNLAIQNGSVGASLFISTRLTDTLEPQLLWIQYFSDGGGMIRPRLNWQAAPNLTVSAGFDIFTGAADGYFGRYNNRDRVYTEMRYAF